jgi:hypothetical protein
VRELSKLLGGEVQLDSEFGKGSAFMVTLPIRIEETFEEDDPEEVLRQEAVGTNRTARRDPGRLQTTPDLTGDDGFDDAE